MKKSRRLKQERHRREEKLEKIGICKSKK
jgi:hypothetical protein